MADEMPARIWIDSKLGMVGYVNEQPPPESDFRHEYVRADLLATARQEAREAAFKEVHDAIDNMDIVITRLGQRRSSDGNGWHSAIQQAHKAITALERAAATDKENAKDAANT